MKKQNRFFVALMAFLFLVTAGCGAQTDTSEPSATDAAVTDEGTDSGKGEAQELFVDPAMRDVSGAWYGKMSGVPMCLTLREDGSYLFGYAGIAPDNWSTTSTEKDASEESSEGENADVMQSGSWTLSGDEILLDEGNEDEMSLLILRGAAITVSGEAEAEEGAFADAENHVDAGEAEETEETEITEEAYYAAAEAAREIRGLYWEDLNLTFTREVPYLYNPAAVDAQAKLTDFAGYWYAVFVESDGIVMDAYLLDAETDLYVEGEHAILGGAIFGDTLVDVSFADGVLSTSYEGEGGTVSVTLRIQEDMLLRMTLDEGTAEEMTFYLEPGLNDDGE